MTAEETALTLQNNGRESVLTVRKTATKQSKRLEFSFQQNTTLQLQTLLPAKQKLSPAWLEN